MIDMKSKNMVVIPKISEQSVRYLSTIFSKYNKVDELPDVTDSPIIHMYPKEDTVTENGDLNGFRDALFSKVVIYIPGRREVYTVGGNCDAININMRSNVRVFKDGSTCITIKGKCSINIYQEIEIDEA